MPRGGQSEEVEQQVGQAEGKLFTHRAAFSRTSVIQAFLGSAPQLTLQLYICVLQETVSIGRGEPASGAELTPLPPAVARFEIWLCNHSSSSSSMRLLGTGCQTFSVVKLVQLAIESYKAT